MSVDEIFLLACLDQIEQCEARLLTWGLVDGFLSSEEMSALVDPMLDDLQYADGLSFVSVATVIKALKDRALLFDVGEEPGSRYRSRMAEAVRLFFRLRQLFPQHRGLTGWQSAPTLVADFRFIWRRRRYPRRGVSAGEGLASITASTSDGYARQAIAALIDSYGPEFALAGFQVDAASRILGGFENQRSSATLVSAGTGSGKTLAFYLPALARIASHIRRDPIQSRWVKILAVYPRNELLKDQFAEVYSQARRLDGSLLAAGRRKVLIGTFFGPTPNEAATAQDSNGWRQHRAGLVCEFLRCPTERCDGEMVWQNADRSTGTERLSCLECGSVIDSDEVILTRSRLQRESPDVLFTTTEMLNQRMGDTRFSHLFGLGDRTQRSVEMMLLDEVHIQDPMTSLNPTMTVGDQIAETVLLRRGADAKAALARAIEVLGLVGMPRPAERVSNYPHQLSGGMRQRVMIAMALACEPKLLIADEPTTALDVTIQKQILELIDDLRRRLGMAVILVTHDLGVIAGRADRVAVMYAGQVMETTTTTAAVRQPAAPLHRGAVRRAAGEGGRRDRTAVQHPGPCRPDLTAPPHGLPVRRPVPVRAGHAARQNEPPLEGDTWDHLYRCFFPVGKAGEPERRRLHGDRGGARPASAQRARPATDEGCLLQPTAW